MVVLELQIALGYSAFEAGCVARSGHDHDVVALVAGRRAGPAHRPAAADDDRAVGDRRRPLACSLASIRARATCTTVLPAAIVFGLGLSATVAPLTSTVLARSPIASSVIASGVNNAAARLAACWRWRCCLSIVHLDTTLPPAVLTERVAVAFGICAGLSVIGGGVIAWLTVGAGAGGDGGGARRLCSCRATIRASRRSESPRERAHTVAMETRSIGKLDASVVGLGCNNFGGRIDEAASEAGRRTPRSTRASRCSTPPTSTAERRSEEYLGRALGSRRDEVIVATKFGGPIDEERKGGASAAYIARAVEDSLRRLGTDRIDLYQLHFPDAATPFEETLAALDKLVDAGKVLEIGGSNFSAEQIDETTQDQLRRADSRDSSACRTSTACSGAVPSGSACSTHAPATGWRSSRTSRSRAVCSPGSTTATRRRPPAPASRACPPSAPPKARCPQGLRPRGSARRVGARSRSHVARARDRMAARAADVASVIAGATKPEQARRTRPPRVEPHRRRPRRDRRAARSSAKAQGE